MNLRFVWMALKKNMRVKNFIVHQMLALVKVQIATFALLM